MAASVVVVAATLLFSAGFLTALPSGITQTELLDEVNQLLSLTNNRLQKQESSIEDQETYKPDTPVAVKNWPKDKLNLGQISGVAVNSDLQPVLFHRADRIWDQ
ncbi:PREDICTED: peptidyl-glycine alpha-amidating monooxygenase B-like [Nicrophorus vespilloides]|uniref:Peptidyl-glycine alpha-amidating monooxygenase B-like n=1 Tax=Nicrophorus vespilloides TaxID=110193 RepID=A0ABM1MCL2_NICVS|nr:PREDICTED: peptidyl-glycine alpha-amidating monooxygenase B-like [Nicrophorus vespilloides]